MTKNIGIHEVLLTIGLFLGGVAVKKVDDISYQIHKLSENMAENNTKLTIYENVLQENKVEFRNIYKILARNQEEIIRLRSEIVDQRKRMSPR